MLRSLLGSLVAITLASCSNVLKPNLVFSKAPEFSLDEVVGVLSRDEQPISISKIVINGHSNVIGCTWPAAADHKTPYALGNIGGIDITNIHGPSLRLKLGSGFSFMGYDESCGTPIRMTVETDRGAWDYDVAT